MIYDFNYTVSSETYPSVGSITIGNTSGSSSCTVSGCSCTGYHWNYYPYTYHVCPEPVKLYQIFCPKPLCTGKFWAAVDEIKKCPVCKSKIKISDEPPSDYEITVTK